ncbi:MAG: hypothetical protein LBV80_09190 [Deltaproteobacteria bacterium]|jgi:hypothetical protein|nr:hypothetical protein [Deltaproteobacteria bacterium]
MLLFDDSKKLEKAFGEEAAATLVHVFEKLDADNKRELATKADLENGLQSVKSELRAEIAAVRSEIKDVENRLTLRLGTMMAASIAIVAALVKLL